MTLNGHMCFHRASPRWPCDEGLAMFYSGNVCPDDGSAQEACTWDALQLWLLGTLCFASLWRLMLRKMHLVVRSLAESKGIQGGVLILMKGCKMLMLQRSKQIVQIE